MSKLKVGKKSGLQYFGYADIQSWNPCYDPSIHIPKTWIGTAIDILNMETIPSNDRLWCVVRSEILSERSMRLFSVWVYSDTLNWVSNPDPRSVEAVAVAERFAYGQATEIELMTAYTAAAAAYSAAAQVAYTAYTANSAAVTLAMSTAAFCATAAAASAYSAAEGARDAATAAAYSAAAQPESAYSAARSRQRHKLIELIFAEAKERRVSK